MGRRARRQQDRPVPGAVPPLLSAIADGELDGQLTALAEAIDARRRLLHTVHSATALAGLRVGDVVRINHAVSPRYLAGLQATVVELDDAAATIRLPRPVGRFSNGVLRCPPLALDRLAGVAAIGPAQASSSSKA